MSKRIVGIVIMIWSLLIIAWASMLVYDLSSPDGPVMAKRAPSSSGAYEAVPARVIVSKTFSRAHFRRQMLARDKDVASVNVKF